jgi:membrane-associated phospholipid phosphatase
MTHRSRISTLTLVHIPRRAALVVVAAVAAGMVACSDQATPPTAPTASSAATGSSAARAEKFDLSSATSTLEWEATARGLVAAHPTVSPIAGARIYALLGIAQYGAVVAADDDEGSDGGGRALYEARRGAVAGASASTLAFLFPDAAAALESQLVTDGAAGPGQTHPHFTRGVETGRAMGARMIDWARTDGFSLAWDKKAPADPLGGGWVGVAGVAPAGFQFPTMRPYYMTSPSQFRPEPPPARTSPEFAAGLEAVRAAALARSAADIASANFWNLSNGTVTAVGYWDERAAEYIAAAGMDERTASHIFAVANSAAMDALIGCWDAKYHYMLLRPSMADASISRSPGVPGFPYGLPNHPSYPSGHSCGSAAAAAVLAAYFPAQAASLSDQVAAAGRSRVLGGIHYPFDVAVGQALGRSVADWTMAYDRQPGGLLAALDRR